LVYMCSDDKFKFVDTFVNGHFGFSLPMDSGSVPG
jgi:hypothetical protein